MEDHTKMDVVLNELELHLKRYAKEEWDETDALMDLFEMGYKLDDFQYDENRYQWAKKVATEHGLISENN